MKNLLITGGTGFLGRMLVDHYVKNEQIKRIVIYSRRWNDQEQLKLKYRDAPNGKKLRFITGDIRDIKSISSAMKGIDTVIHAAAYKHVSMAEYNPREVIGVNIEGSQNVIDAAIENGVEQVLAISSDKAVDAYNLYGKTKAVMESMMVAANNLGSTHFNVARYGNVWNSSGSVIEKWRREIQKDNPILTITSRSMTRFFLFENTLLEYMDSCLTGGTVARGMIFIPKMESVQIGDLVQAFANIAIMNGKNGATEIIGVQPGEKMHESLVSDNEVSRARVVNTSKRIAAIYPLNADWQTKKIPANLYGINISEYRSETATRMAEDDIIKAINSTN